MSYQGWANHATWVVHLHLANDAGLFEGARETIEDAKRNSPHTPKVEAMYALQAFVDSIFYDIDLHITNPATMMRSDLIQSALNDIDWNSIVEALTEE